LPERNTFSRAVFRAAMAVLSLLAWTPAEVAVGQASQTQPALAPGREFKVIDPDSGESGYYLLYVPEDYRPDRRWPVVVYYHGLNGLPQTDLFRSALGGKGFLVVAMEYYKRGMEGYQYMTTEDVRILHHVLDSLGKKVRIDRTRLFVAGFSKGGFYASGLLCELPRFWRGAVILGAGMRSEPAHPDALAGKPIFIGCGTRDFLVKNVTEAADTYRRLGCDVTFESWPDRGHSVPEDNGIGRWLLQHAYEDGPAERENVPAPRDVQGNSDGSSPDVSGWAYAGIAVGIAMATGIGVLFLRARLRRSVH